MTDIEMKKEDIVEETLGEDNAGSVKIADDVVATIAGLAATQVEGVAGMSGGVVNGLGELLGRKNLTKGVKVEVGESETIVDLYMVVNFGVTIPEVAQSVQASVQQAVENMTGLKVVAVNIHITGVTFPQGHPAVAGNEEE